MRRRLGRLLAIASIVVGLAVNCSGDVAPSPETTGNVPSRVTEAPIGATVDSSGSAADLDAAVDALIDRLGPREAFDAVLGALESGMSVDDIIADPDSIEAP